MDLKKVEKTISSYLKENFNGEFEFKNDGGILSVSGDFYVEALGEEVAFSFCYADYDFATFTFFLTDVDEEDCDTLIKINEINHDFDMFAVFADGLLQVRHHNDLIYENDVVTYTERVFDEFLDDDFIDALKSFYE